MVGICGLGTIARWFYMVANTYSTGNVKDNAFIVHKRIEAIVDGYKGPSYLPIYDIYYICNIRAHAGTLHN